MISFGLSVLVSNLKILTFSYTNTVFSVLMIFASYILYIVIYFFFTEYNIQNDLYKSFDLISLNMTIFATTFLIASFFFLLDLAYQRYVDFVSQSDHFNYLKTHSREFNLLQKISMSESLTK